MRAGGSRMSLGPYEPAASFAMPRSDSAELRVKSGARVIDVLEYLHRLDRPARSEEHTSELQSLMRISYAVFCLKKKKKLKHNNNKPYHKSDEDISKERQTYIHCTDSNE